MAMLEMGTQHHHHTHICAPVIGLKLLLSSRQELILTIKWPRIVARALVPLIT